MSRAKRRNGPRRPSGLTEWVPKDLRLWDNRVNKDCLLKMMIPGILLELRSNLRLSFTYLSKRRHGDSLARDLRGSVLEII